MKIIWIVYKISYWFCMATELTCKLSKWSEYRMEFRASNKCLINIFGWLRSLDTMLRRCDMQQNGIAESTSWCGDFQNTVQVLLGMRFIENMAILLLLSKMSQKDFTILFKLLRQGLTFWWKIMKLLYKKYYITWVWIVQVSYKNQLLITHQSGIHWIDMRVRNITNGDFNFKSDNVISFLLKMCTNCGARYKFEWWLIRKNI